MGERKRGTVVDRRVRKMELWKGRRGRIGVSSSDTSIFFISQQKRLFKVGYKKGT